MKKRRVLFLLVCIAALVSGLLHYSGSLESTQEKIYDRFFVRATPPADVVIFAIDDESLKELGGWPLPRSVLAQALGNLQGTRAVAFDLILADPSSRGVADDAILAQALRDSSVPVIIPFQFDERGLKTTEPLPAFSSHSTRAYVNLSLDSDGAIRSYQPKREGEMSMSASLLPDVNSIPSAVRIRYYGPASTVLTIPFIDL